MLMLVLLVILLLLLAITVINTNASIAIDITHRAHIVQPSLQRSSSLKSNIGRIRDGAQVSCCAHRAFWNPLYVLSQPQLVAQGHVLQSFLCSTSSCSVI